jgi:hypothetical protein
MKNKLMNMHRRHLKDLMLGSLIVFFVVMYVLVFQNVEQTKRRLGITDEMVQQYRREQAALCPSGFSPMSETSDDCFNLRGMIVPKLKHSAPSHLQVK